MFLGYVAKDFALWPWLRPGYESAAPTGSATLVGQVGRTRGPLDPRGWVSIHGELWQAEALPGTAPIPAGAEVRVERVERLVLFVSPAEPPPGAERVAR